MMKHLNMLRFHYFLIYLVKFFQINNLNSIIFWQSENAIFKLTSAKENQGISELFTAIASKLENINFSANAPNKKP